MWQKNEKKKRRSNAVADHTEIVTNSNHSQPYHRRNIRNCETNTNNSLVHALKSHNPTYHWRYHLNQSCINNTKKKNISKSENKISMIFKKKIKILFRTIHIHTSSPTIKWILNKQNWNVLVWFASIRKKATEEKYKTTTNYSRLETPAYFI